MALPPTPVDLPIVITPPANTAAIHLSLVGGGKATPPATPKSDFVTSLARCNAVFDVAAENSGIYVITLVGPIGSGKTTLAEHLMATHPNFSRCGPPPPPPCINNTAAVNLVKEGMAAAKKSKFVVILFDHYDHPVHHALHDHVYFDHGEHASQHIVIIRTLTELPACDAHGVEHIILDGEIRVNLKNVPSIHFDILYRNLIAAGVTDAAELDAIMARSHAHPELAIDVTADRIAFLVKGARSIKSVPLADALVTMLDENAT